MASAPPRQFDPNTPPVTIVPSQLSERDVVAGNAFSAAQAALDKVEEQYEQNATVWGGIDVNFEELRAITDDFVVPTVPSDPDTTFEIPELPDDFEPSNIRTVQIDDAPEFTELDPVLENITVPGDLDIDSIEPGSPPSITTSYTFPDDLSITDPDLPSLSTITIPTADSISFPSFTETLPSASSLTVPGLTFSFTEDAYNSTLHTAIATELIDRVQNGGTGLNADVETAIFNRGRDREIAQSIAEEQQILTEFQNGGWTIPTGVQTSMLRKAKQDAQSKVSTINRDITIKQAELEQSNILAAIQSSIQYEGQLVSLHDSKQGRKLETAVKTQEFLISIYNAEVIQFQQEVEVYKAFASAYEARVRAEVAKIQKFEAEIRAQQLILETDKTAIDLYLAQFQGTKNLIDNYRAQIEAINSRIAAEGQRLQNYRVEVDAFGARVAAKGQEYDNYTTRLNGELAKINIFDSKVKAYAARVQAYAAESEVERDAVSSDIEAEKVRLEQYQTKLRSILSLAQVKSQTFQQQVAEFQAKANIFTAQGQMEASRIAAQNSTLQLQLAAKQSEHEGAVEEAKFNATVAIQGAQTAIAIAQEEAKIQAQLAASAYAGVNVSAQLSHGTSISLSEEQNYNWAGTNTA